MQNDVLVTTGAALIAGILASLVTYVLGVRTLHGQHGSEFSAEKVARKLLSHPNFTRRKFDTIKAYIGGFDDEELRRILVRAGAIRIPSQTSTEQWGLLKRNKEKLQNDKARN